MAVSYNNFLANFPENQIFIRKFSDKLTHNKFTYKQGLNEDTIAFNPHGSCQAGGLYFTTPDHITNFDSFGNKIGLLELCPDASFYCDPEGCQYKTNKFIVTKIYDNYYEFLSDLSLEMLKVVLYHNPSLIYYVKEQTEEICKLVVKKYGFLLCHIKNQTEELCKLAIHQDGLALKYVISQTEELCKLAVQQNGLALQYVISQTEELCKLAIEQNKFALYYVKK
jgi:hypothetical protein